MILNRRCPWALAMLLVLACGCGQVSNPNLPAQVSGAVSFNGKPLTAGTLSFYDKTSGSPAGGAVIRSDGKYAAADMPAGDLVVTVETESANPAKKPREYKGKTMPGMSSGKHKMQMGPMPEHAAPAGQEYVKIPAKYADKQKSGLSVTLSKGKNACDITLTE